MAERMSRDVKKMLRSGDKSVLSDIQEVIDELKLNPHKNSQSGIIVIPSFLLISNKSFETIIPLFIFFNF